MKLGSVLMASLAGVAYVQDRPYLTAVILITAYLFSTGYFFPGRGDEDEVL